MAWFKTRLQAPAASLPNWRQICAVFFANRPWFFALHCTYTHEMCNAKKPAFEPCPRGGMVQNTVTNTGQRRCQIGSQFCAVFCANRPSPCVALHIYTRDVQPKRPCFEPCPRGHARACDVWKRTRV